MRKYEYSNELANLVKKFLVDNDWHFAFDENTGVFEFGLRVKSKIQKINYIVDVHEDEIVVYGMCPIGANHTESNMMVQMAEFLCRANYGLKNGCFELDFRDGEIRYKSFIDCEDMMPSNEVIKNSIHCTAAMFKRYAPGIVDIIFSGSSAKVSETKKGGRRTISCSTSLLAKTILNALRYALGIFSGKAIYNFGTPERLRTLRRSIFTVKASAPAGLSCCAG